MKRLLASSPGRGATSLQRPEGWRQGCSVPTADRRSQECCRNGRKATLKGHHTVSFGVIALTVRLQTRAHRWRQRAPSLRTRAGGRLKGCAFGETGRQTVNTVCQRSHWGWRMGVAVTDSFQEWQRAFQLKREPAVMPAAIAEQPSLRSKCRLTQ